MSRLRISSVVVLSLLLAAASGCGGPPGVSPQVYVSYKPPYVPVSITCHSDGTISLSAETSIVTNFGVFSVGAELPLNSQDDCYYLIIRDRRRPDKGDTVFQVHGTNDSVFVRMDGRSLISVGRNHTVIDISDGKIRTIEVGPAPSAGFAHVGTTDKEQDRTSEGSILGVWWSASERREVTFMKDGRIISRAPSEPTFLAGTYDYNAADQTIRVRFPSDPEYNEEGSISWDGEDAFWHINDRYQGIKVLWTRR